MQNLFVITNYSIHFGGNKYRLQMNEIIVINGKNKQKFLKVLFNNISFHVLHLRMLIISGLLHQLVGPENYLIIYQQSLQDGSIRKQHLRFDMYSKCNNLLSHSTCSHIQINCRNSEGGKKINCGTLINAPAVLKQTILISNSNARMRWQKKKIFIKMYN